MKADPPRRPYKNWNPNRYTVAGLRRAAEAEGLGIDLAERASLLAQAVPPCPLDHPEACPWEARRAPPLSGVACPWVGCPMHLWGSVDLDTGTLRTRWPDTDPTEIPRCCALEVAREAPAAWGWDERVEDPNAEWVPDAHHSFYTLGEVMGLTHQGASNFVAEALAHARESAALLGLDFEALLPSPPPRRAPESYPATTGASITSEQRRRWWWAKGPPPGAFCFDGGARR